MLSLLDQFFVYHPEPWQDRDWARLSGLPLEDVWFQAADGARLFDWHTETQTDRPIHTLVPRQCPQNHQSIGEPVRALSDRTVRLHLQLSWQRAESGKAIRGRLRPRAGSIAHFN